MRLVNYLAGHFLAVGDFEVEGQALAGDHFVFLFEGRDVLLIEFF